MSPTAKRPKTDVGRKRKSVKKPKSKPREGNVMAGPTLHALLIGCDFYFPNTLPEGSYGSLRGCVRDVERVEAFLRQRAGLDDSRLIKLTASHGGTKGPTESKNRWPTYENIVGAFRAVIDRAESGDLVYVHYSGHGGQCNTLIPKVKGSKGVDETLVPIDIKDSSARYVRDIEIAKLLKEMTAKRLLVTMVLDNCHSGGATRGALAIDPTPPDGPIAIRGVNFVDSTPRPADSLVGSLAELAEPISATRSATRSMMAATEDDGCVVLAACSPNELANEFAFDGTNRQGALTYWFLNCVDEAGSKVTFRAVFGRVLHQIHGQFPSQTPVLFGNPDREILGRSIASVAESTPVSKITKKGSITLQTGLAGLTRKGAEFAVYPAGARGFGDEHRIAVVRVDSVGAAEATAETVETFGSRKIEVGDRAVLVGVAQTLVRTVRIERFDGKPPGTKDTALRKVRQVAPSKGWWCLADDADCPADFVVSTTKDGEEYEICDAGGNPLQVRPALKTSAPTAAAELADRLTHLARYRVVRDLDNQDRLSALSGKIVASLSKAPRGYEAGDPLPVDRLTPYPVGAVPKLHPEDWVVLCVENRSANTVNVVAIDLAPDWSISVAHPGEQFHPLGAGEKWLLPLCVSLPPGIEGGLDTLKVVATVGPPPPFETFVLPQLDRPVARSITSVATRSALDPLSELFNVVTAAGALTRNAVSVSSAAGEWCVSQVEVRTEATK